MEKECDQKGGILMLTSRAKRDLEDYRKRFLSPSVMEKEYDREDLRRMFEALIEKLGCSVEDIEETAYRIKREYEYRKWLQFHNFE